MGWTALSSELGTLKALHGANVLLFLNIAYFAPSLPILVTQLVLKSSLNVSYTLCGDCNRCLHCIHSVSYSDSIVSVLFMLRGMLHASFFGQTAVVYLIPS